MPTTPYMIVTMAQLIMMSGKLDKLDKIGEYNDTHERVLWLDPRGGILQVLVVRRVDNTIHRINRCPADKC